MITAESMVTEMPLRDGEEVVHHDHICERSHSYRLVAMAVDSDPTC